MSNDDSRSSTNFVRRLIDDDMQASGGNSIVATRFPPEPNGYLHIGHAKSICLNFGIAEDYSGTCNLRFDDTNPHKENAEYVRAIQEDVKWLGFDWGDRLFYASDYFEQLHDYAVELIKAGKAYVCDLNADQMREYRGTLTQPGKNSPYRERSIEENLGLFAQMRAGEFVDGERLLRAKIDMSAPNMNLRDPALYRIRQGAVHHQTGDAWCIYPMYDFTHPISDALEGITHSLCTLEFLDHRPLYDWVLDNVSVPCHPKQIEFSRLNLQYTLMSKRKLGELVEGKHVTGWDDPRMPTIAGMRRRGFTPASIREFCSNIGVSKSENIVEMGVLEHCIREDLNANAPRRLAVLHPLKVVISNYTNEVGEKITVPNHPQDDSMGTRTLMFTRELYIDKNDFRETANKKFKRLVAGGEVRLRNAYVIRCDEVIKDDEGEIIELHCSYDEKTLGAQPEGRKVKGVIHWVSANKGITVEVRLYDRLFNQPLPGAGEKDDFLQDLNPESLAVLSGCLVEPGLFDAQAGEQFQFEREGYFCLDTTSSPESPVFNRIVTLRDSWAKMELKQ